MIMPCRITDESVYNPWEGDEDVVETRCPLTLTLDELMGDSYYPHIAKNNNWGFDLSVEGDDGVEMEAKRLHPAAAESLADFCRRYLHAYEKAAS